MPQYNHYVVYIDEHKGEFVLDGARVHGMGYTRDRDVNARMCTSVHSIDQAVRYTEAGAKRRVEYLAASEVTAPGYFTSVHKRQAQILSVMHL
jgi:hypothetical protein